MKSLNNKPFQVTLLLDGKIDVMMDDGDIFVPMTSEQAIQLGSALIREASKAIKIRKELSQK